MDTARFGPDGTGATTLFLDTSGLFAYFHPNATEHAEVRTFFRAIADGQLPYRPLLTHTYVVDELVTLLQSKASPALARDAYETLVASESIDLVYENESTFEAAGGALSTYDDHEISFTDHTIAVTMRDRNVDHVLAYDGDFETFDLTVVPR